MIENNIISIEGYKIGDNLCFYSYAYSYNSQDWLGGYYINVNIHGVIRENNGKMIRVEIHSISFDDFELITQFKQGTIRSFDNLWFTINVNNFNLINFMTKSILKLDNDEVDSNIEIPPLNCEGNCFFWINPRYYDDNCKYGNWIINVVN